MSTLFTLKVTNPITEVRFLEPFMFGKVELLDVYGLDKPCLIYCDAIAINYSLTNIGSVYPGRSIVPENSSLLGIFPSKEVTRIPGVGIKRDGFELSISNLDGSSPVFNEPVVISLRISERK